MGEVAEQIKLDFVYLFYQRVFSSTDKLKNKRENGFSEEYNL